MVHEYWLSRELKIGLLSTDQDPRSGDRSSEVTELNRAEPDLALFQVPEGDPRQRYQSADSLETMRHQGRSSAA